MVCAMNLRTSLTYRRVIHSILFYQVINRVKMAEGQKIPSSKIINVIVKTPKEKIDIEIEEDASIKDVSPFYPVLYFCC